MQLFPREIDFEQVVFDHVLMYGIQFWYRIDLNPLWTFVKFLYRNLNSYAAIQEVYSIPRI